MIRAGAYFGLHFDFHAVSQAKGIGTKTDPDFIGKLIDSIKPDYVQCDTKGHPGYATFMSEYGTVAPGLATDHIRILREETRKRGVALVAHYSGVIDDRACALHTDWALIGRDGKPSTRKTSVIKPYVDQQLVPQLKELALKYGLDGAWIDGECWGTEQDYSPELLSEFYSESGYDAIDADPFSGSGLAFRYFCRQKFTEYIEHYCIEIKKVCPDFDITSNYAHSPQMPEKPLECLDFLSADICECADIRIIPRCFAGKGKPWDAMSWGMSGCWNTPEGGFIPISMKNISRIMREAAMTISLGGGYQIDNLMTMQGEIRSAEIENMKVLSAFMLQRKKYNYLSSPLKNVAILYSDYDRTRKVPSLYGAMPIGKAACDIVLDGGRAVDVIYDYQVADKDFTSRNAIIVPEITYMTDNIKESLLEFAYDGGSLIICGVDSCKLFSAGGTVDDKTVYIEDNLRDTMFGIKGNIMFFEAGSGISLCKCHDGVMDLKTPEVITAISRQYGKGNLYFIGWNILSDYDSSHNFGECGFMRHILDMADPEPIAYLEHGIWRADIIPAEKDGKLYVNVINTNELYYDRYGVSYGDIPPVCDITVAVKYSCVPKSVMLQPQNKRAEYSFYGKYLHINISRLDIHTIIEII